MKFVYRILLLLMFASGCKDKYVGSIHLPPTGYLVVEGYINSGVGSTNIHLSRATSLDSIYIHQEIGATVYIESNLGLSFALTEDSPGQYVAGQVTLDPNQTYRLHIKTTNGKEYISGYEEVRITPPIDSVSHTMSSDKASIYVSTHDDQNKTIYYQWKFDETWLYLSAYFSISTYKDGKIVTRDFNNDQIFQCWEQDSSTDIIVGTSDKLSRDVISNFLVTTVPYGGSLKLDHRYSILVKQYALTKDWYNWKVLMKKNTEQLGTIFDPQPTQTSGNLRCISDSNEIVIGFVGCTSETEKRIFIDNSEVPPGVRYDNLHGCTLDSLRTLDSATLDQTFSNGFEIPVQLIYNQMGQPIGVSHSVYECVDCRAHGGTNIKPDYWQ